MAAFVTLASIFQLWMTTKAEVDLSNGGSCDLRRPGRIRTVPTLEQVVVFVVAVPHGGLLTLVGRRGARWAGGGRGWAGYRVIWGPTQEIFFLS